MAPELQYIDQLIRYRLEFYFPSGQPEEAPVIPDLNDWELPMADFLYKNNLTIFEATALLVALAPAIQPGLFDRAIESKLKDANNFPAIGGVRGKNSRAFLPTGETLLFLLAGDDLAARLSIQTIFGAEHKFSVKKILWLEELPPGEPPLSGRLILSQDYLDIFFYGKPGAPHFSMSFPAKKIQEARDWSALVINEELHKQISEILSWVKYNDELLQGWQMGDRLKKGYRALFYGSPGTGKTLTAGLLGKELSKDVYKIDLSMVVSKYIGETEKNLELLFARAEDKGWVLFFDEADALFGKRTNVRDAHDKYANQEVSYLLQRIEDFNGLIILATNMKGNIDDAFVRRFNSILKFPFPDAGERALIWEKSFPAHAVYTRDYETDPVNSHGKLDIPDVVKKYELSGGSIINAVHFASLKAVERKRNGVNGNGDFHSPLIISLNDVMQGIKKELTKEGKPFVG